MFVGKKAVNLTKSYFYFLKYFTMHAILKHLNKQTDYILFANKKMFLLVVICSIKNEFIQNCSKQDCC